MLGWGYRGRVGMVWAAMMLVARVAAASEYHGQVLFGGAPVPGATVTATQGDKKVSVVSDTQGSYFFADLADGTWKITVEMRFFKTVEREVTVAKDAPGTPIELTLLAVGEIMAQTKAVTVQAGPQTAPVKVAADATGAGKSAGAKAPARTADAGPAPEAPRPAEDAPKPADGFLINGSSNNAATSQFSLAQAFGNNRTGGHSLYTGGLSVIVGNSALNARPFSITGQQLPKSAYNLVTAGVTLGGPLNIPHLMPRGPNFFIAYQWTRQATAQTEQGLVPTAAERGGNLSALLNSAGEPAVIVNPATGQPFAAGNVGPVNPVATALLALYPLPNLTGSSRYNYEVPILNSTHVDAGQMRLNKGVTRKDNVDGGYAFQSIRNSNVNLFGFVDATDTLGMRGNVNENHRLNQRLYLTAGYVFSRLRTQVKPNFEGVTNVSGNVGIAADGAGNLQDTRDWGPPNLSFSSGIAGLNDANSAYNRNETNEGLGSVQWYRGKHNVTAGLDFQRREYNYLTQSNPRGTYTFTGAATSGTVNAVATTGSDFADFLLGIPDTSQIAYGNADKYFRENVYALYATDDWRVRPELTINAGMRWEYGAPITELKNRLVNLDVAPGFANVAAVLASSPKGTLTGTQYPTSLVRPDKLGFEPRVGVSWRPIAGSTLVIRAGYGVYDDTSVYGATALAMAQQSPLSTSLSVPNVIGHGVPCETLANGFNAACSTTTTRDTFGVDPNFRVGYAQTWQLLAQRDLPGALQATLTYLGIKGTRGVQEFLPNTYPIGATSPCPSCPLGYAYRTSNGDSTRESGQVQVRRRLKNGFTASVAYTYSKSIDDDAALGGQGPVAPGAAAQAAQNVQIAQNWLNLKGERGLSTFDQRHLLNASVQYTSGQGLGGGSLMEGWRGTLLKEWTLTTTILAGSGLPETPVYFADVPGTGVTGTIRANVTGQSVKAAPAGVYLNPAAYVSPAPGQWGDAGRNSIEGPDQFTLNSSLARTFRLTGKYNLDTRLDATNTLNHPVFSSWINTVNSSQFGLPAAANGMRTVQITTRLRF